MLTCELSVNGRPVGKMTVRRMDQIDEEGNFVYFYNVQTSDGSLGRSGLVWHDLSAGIWALVQRVIEISHPENWFPGPDQKAG